MKHVIELDDGERQMVIKALATQSIVCPGWDHSLNAIALKMDNAVPKELSTPPHIQVTRGEMYDEFRRMSIEQIGDRLDDFQTVLRAGGR